MLNFFRKSEQIRKCCEQIIFRCTHQQAARSYDVGIGIPEKMGAWQLMSYGTENNLEFSSNVDVPILEGPNEVLVKVSATSVNPLDVEMLRGFGSTLLNCMRKIERCCEQTEAELPKILGRDFAGTVVATSQDVTRFNIGDEVYGVVKPHNPGCHAEYALTTGSLISKKPSFLSMEETCGIPYTSLTAWGALKISGELIFRSAAHKRVLVLGGSGGVGNAAIQMLNAWKADVVATCSTDAVSLVNELSPKAIIDYTSADYLPNIKAAGKYDLILDAAGLGDKRLATYVPYLNAYGSIITLISPLLKNIDSYGIVGGVVKSAVDVVVPNVTSGALANRSLIKWGFFVPSETAVREIEKLVDEKKLKAIVEQTFDFSELPKAYTKLRNGHSRGKTVISMNKNSHEEPV